MGFVISKGLGNCINMEYYSFISDSASLPQNIVAQFESLLSAKGLEIA